MSRRWGPPWPAARHLTLLPWALAAVIFGLRGAAFALTGGHLGISSEAQVGLARAMGTAGRLELELSGVHPGWSKAALHPMLGWLGGQVVDLRLATAALTWLYAAALIVLGARLARRLWGEPAAAASAVVLALAPWLAGDLREYALAAALALAATERALAAIDGGRLQALTAAVLLGLLASARWEGALWAVIILVGWSWRDPRAPLLGAGPAVLAFGLIQELAYPDSSLVERLGERLGLVHLMTVELAGAALDQADVGRLGQVRDGVPALLSTPELGFVAAWLQGIPAALQGIAEMLFHPLTWPVWGLALLGARGSSLARRMLTGALLVALALSFMPPKQGYLVLPACLVAIVAGRGLAGLGSRGRALAGGLLVIGAVLAWGSATPDPEERAHLDLLRAVAAELRASTPADTHVLAEEDLCVLLLAQRRCTFLPEDPAAAGPWLVGRGVDLAVLPDQRRDVHDALRLAGLSPGLPRPLPGGYHALSLSRQPAP